MGNLLVHQRRRSTEFLVDCLRQDYKRMIRAATSVSDNLLHPAFRNTSRPWSPGEEPTNNEITLSAMPAVMRYPQTWLNTPATVAGRYPAALSNYLRQVRGLLPGDWTGPQRCHNSNMRSTTLPNGDTVEAEAPYLFFCGPVHLPRRRR
jgi:hypothetical protein